MEYPFKIQKNKHMHKLRRERIRLNGKTMGSYRYISMDSKAEVLTAT